MTEQPEQTPQNPARPKPSGKGNLITGLASIALAVIFILVVWKLGGGALSALRRLSVAIHHGYVALDPANRLGICIIGAALLHAHFTKGGRH